MTRTRSGRNVSSTSMASCANVITSCPSKLVPDHVLNFCWFQLINHWFAHESRQADVHWWPTGPVNGVPVHRKRTAAIPVRFSIRIQLWHQPEARVRIHTGASTLPHPGPASISVKKKKNRRHCCHVMNIMNILGWSNKLTRSSTMF